MSLRRLGRDIPQRGDCPGAADFSCPCGTTASTTTDDTTTFDAVVRRHFSGDHS